MHSTQGKTTWNTFLGYFKFIFDNLKQKIEIFVLNKLDSDSDEVVEVLDFKNKIKLNLNKVSFAKSGQANAMPSWRTCTRTRQTQTCGTPILKT